MQNQTTEPTVEFDFETVFRDLDGEQPDQPTGEDMRRLAIALRAIMRWVAGDPTHVTSEGMLERAAILAWHVVPEFGRLKQTELAKLLGLNHRQSINRHVASFKEQFPGVLIAMRSNEPGITERLETEPE